MIIPVKCFTCGKVLADKYRYYKRQVRMRKNLNLEENEDDVVYLTQLNKNKTIEGVVLDELKLSKMCCRRHMLTHVDIE
jgi:DNA-directed RNA polymerase subunit N (RpoN/RPB10)